MTLRLGLYLTTWPRTDRVPPRWAELRALARDVEALGVENLWVADEPGFWECWTILTAAAEATTSIRVGPLVASTRYRNPALFATMVRALDEVSGGRVTLVLGAGTGPTDKRWSALGYDGSDHIARFAEAVEVTARLLREPTFAFEGRFHSVDHPRIGPEGPQGARLPIWVAAGRARTMAVAARFGDAVNITTPLTGAASVEAVRPVLELACSEAGRDPATLQITGVVRLAPSPDGNVEADRADTIAGTPAQVAERLAELHAAGISHLTCFIGDEDDHRQYPALTRQALHRFGDVLAALRTSS